MDNGWSAPYEEGCDAAGDLWVFPSLSAAPVDDRHVILTNKFVEGARAYVERWPGEVVVCMQRKQSGDGNLDETTYTINDLPFRLEWRADSPARLTSQISSAGLALVSLVDEHLPMIDQCAAAGVPSVLVSEYAVQTRRQIIRATTANPIVQMRRILWTNGLERRIRKVVQMASGIQCNGTPTFDAYRSLNPCPLLYFDGRVSTNELATTEQIASRCRHLEAGAPLRLAFSGRLIAMKGADHLPRIAAALDRLGVAFTFDVCGGGALEDSLPREIERLNLADRMRMRGVLDFHAELMPFMRESVDLFVCCHPQGDPSCSYLETMSCGVPIVGYDNEAFAGVARESGVGWTTPLGDPEAVARQIARLDMTRDELISASHAARHFAATHAFETTMDARVAHMLRCCDKTSAGVS